ncbi:hypothetical protein PROFUN_16461 [Planoprotostelium fungivorum]|uniref:Uncharacterized protein n=1 Tax=Planoprotostelium fungivorum TaxID=1890364 RepID=A0A2P6MQP4_9EUKA|nr:hypothetical protein PROFUN_16461 [Planoprotostelium fungivorum]
MGHARKFNRLYKANRRTHHAASLNLIATDLSVGLRKLNQKVRLNTIINIKMWVIATATDSLFMRHLLSSRSLFGSSHIIVGLAQCFLKNRSHPQHDCCQSDKSEGQTLSQQNELNDGVSIDTCPRLSPIDGAVTMHRYQQFGNHHSKFRLTSTTDYSTSPSPVCESVLTFELTTLKRGLGPKKKSHLQEGRLWSAPIPTGPIVVTKKAPEKGSSITLPKSTSCHSPLKHWLRFERLPSRSEPNEI